MIRNPNAGKNKKSCNTLVLLISKAKCIKKETNGLKVQSCLFYRVPLRTLTFFHDCDENNYARPSPAHVSLPFFPTPPRPVTWYTPNMVISPSSMVNEQEGKHDECVTRKLRIFGSTFATPRQPPSVKLAVNLVEEAMTDDSAEIEPALLGNSCLLSAVFLTHAEPRIATSVRNPVSILMFSGF